MSVAEIKNNFHSLIDKVNDGELLKYFYDAFLFSSEKTFLNDLSDEEKKELMDSFNESEDENNLLSHEYVKEKHKKWLEK